MLKSRTHFVGVMGWPLDYTLSPVIHAAAFRNLGLDWVYLEWPVEPARLAGAVAGLRALGAAGANVTMPYKESVTQYVDELSGDARALRAVNTIQRVGEKLIGHNTDVDGFREFLVADAGVRVAGRKALVLGAGGAARAVVRALSDLGAAQVRIAARRREKGRVVLDLVPARGSEVVDWESAGDAAVDSDIVVNATPVGSGAGELVLSDVVWRPGQVVCDLVYSPPVTPLLQKAREKGAEAWGGLGMLIHQAALSFRIWTGKNPSIEAMSAAAVRAIGAH